MTTPPRPTGRVIVVTYLTKEIETMKNARFWAWINGDWVKITLRPGQTLEWTTFGRHEEGWHLSAHIWEFDAIDQIVTESHYTDGTDCDGRTQTSNARHCHIERLSENGQQTRVEERWNWQSEDYVFVACRECPALPDWQEGESSQRDYYAESMNY